MRLTLGRTHGQKARREMLRSADLFAGMGGWTLALQGAATPSVYCDIDARAQTFLRAEMDAGRLPRAPIVPDVRDLSALVACGPADLVTAGFPCVGFSAAGSKHGLDDARSALFHDAVAAAVALRATHVLLENVPEVLRHARDICDVLVAAGFTDVRWTVVSASDVGAPHVRRRGFCKASRRGSVLPLDGLSPLPGWGEYPPPPVRLGGHSARETAELALFGNSLVPQAARAAMLHMAASRPGAHSPVAPQHGAFVDGEFRCLPPPEARGPAPAQLVLCPRHYDRGDTPSRSRTAELECVSRKWWPTPRHGPVSHSHVLTERTSWDLATAARFAQSVGGVALPSTTWRDRLNPDFVRYLMRGGRAHSDMASIDPPCAEKTQLSPNSQPSAKVQSGPNRHCAPNVQDALKEHPAENVHPTPNTDASPKALA